MARFRSGAVYAEYGRRYTQRGYWFDKEREWAVSSLFRIETNGRQKHTEIVPGTEFSVDWSVSKKITKNWELGLVGTYLVQVENDKGAATLNADGSRRFAKDSIHNIGAQAVYYNLEKKIFRVLGLPSGLQCQRQTGSLECHDRLYLFFLMNGLAEEMPAFKNGKSTAAENANHGGNRPRRSVRRHFRA